MMSYWCTVCFSIYDLSYLLLTNRSLLIMQMILRCYANVTAVNLFEVDMANSMYFNLLILLK